MATDFFTRREVETKFIAVEKINILYNLFTTLLIIIFYNRLNNPQNMLMGRFVILAGTFAMIYAYTKYPSRFMVMVRMVTQMFLLNYWYPDTFEFNRIFPNLDHLFAAAEFNIFGCQPALLFDRALGGDFWREIFNMGYWLYYPMITVVTMYYFFKRPAKVEKCTFVIMATFFIHYIIYIFLPVAGPQFYFPVIGEAAAGSGVYENIGNYFNLYPEISIAQEGKGIFFTELVNLAQSAGERPTAAFPSSHIGVSLVMMILAFKASRRLFATLLPVFVLLCCATVYIKAHYLVDAIAGLMSGAISYIIATRLYKATIQ